MGQITALEARRTPSTASRRPAESARTARVPLGNGRTRSLEHLDTHVLAGIAERAELTGECTITLDDIADARAVLEPDSDAHRLHWASRSKGGSKSTDIAGMRLVWALTQADPLEHGYVVAAGEEQAVRLLDRARGLVARTPGLADRVRSSSILVTRSNHKAPCISDTSRWQRLTPRVAPPTSTGGSADA